MHEFDQVLGYRDARKVVDWKLVVAGWEALVRPLGLLERHKLCVQLDTFVETQLRVSRLQCSYEYFAVEAAHCPLGLGDRAVR